MYYDAKQEADSAPVGTIPITPEQVNLLFFELYTIDFMA